MGGNKKRLYIALYPSGVTNNEERRYHWGFLVGPKNENQSEVAGIQYHVKNSPATGWVYEEVPLNIVKNTHNLLGRILIAKVEDGERLARIFRETLVVQGDPSWRCRSWVADALKTIAADGRAVGTSTLEWRRIEHVAREYIGNKAAGGRYNDAALLAHPKPMWDMMSQKEIFP